MRKRDRTEEALAALRAARAQPRSEEALALVRRSLSDRSSFVVAAAAGLAGEAELRELQQPLAQAFARMLEDPARTDKGCKAKSAIALALYRCDARELALFQTGLRHVQREPVWGGTQDTAAELRGVCALALAALGGPEVLCDLAELLADPEPIARTHAARALAATGQDGAAPLLRYKALLGDPAPEVQVECQLALLSLTPGPALPFVAALLEGGTEARREAAALALGQSRDERALVPLLRFAERALSERRTALLAISMLRTPAALAHLLGLVEAGATAAAEDALGALALHRYDDGLRRRVEAVVDARASRQLKEAFAASFRLPE